jgi:hypothetical protein
MHIPLDTSFNISLELQDDENNAKLKLFYKTNI